MAFGAGLSKTAENSPLHFADAAVWDPQKGWQLKGKPATHMVFPLTSLPSELKNTKLEELVIRTDLQLQTAVQFTTIPGSQKAFDGSRTVAPLVADFDIVTIDASNLPWALGKPPQAGEVLRVDLALVEGANEVMRTSLSPRRENSQLFAPDPLQCFVTKAKGESKLESLKARVQFHISGSPSPVSWSGSDKDLREHGMSLVFQQSDLTPKSP